MNVLVSKHKIGFVNNKLPWLLTSDPEEKEITIWRPTIEVVAFKVSTDKYKDREQKKCLGVSIARNLDKQGRIALTTRLIGKTKERKGSL